MSANNASLYESDDSSYTAPSKQLGGNSLYDAAGAAIDKPIDYKGLGLKSKQIVEGSGPLQPPIGQTISGAAKDVDENLLGGYGDYILPTAVGLYGLKKLWDKFGPNDNNPPNNPPGGPAAPSQAGPVAPTQPQMSPIEQQKLRILELKAESEQLKLDTQKEKIARDNANYEAKQAQQAAKAKQAGGGTMTESEMKMLSASETAKISKAVIADQKAQQAAALTQQAQAAPAQTKIAETATAIKPTTPLFETPGIADVIAGAKKPPVSHEKMPEGWGKGMTWLVNQHGVEGAQAYIDEFNNGKPFTSHDQMKKSYAENTFRPKFSDVPKDVRKSRGMVAPPQTSMRMLSTPMSGGGYRPGVDNLQHSLNPLKL